MKYFIANWKANKNFDEAKQWVNQFLKIYRPKTERTVIICPPFPFIPLLHQAVNHLKNIKIGSQDLSAFESGTYTGEVTAKTLKGLVDYVIIGHSERRKNFHESQDLIGQKISLAKKYQIEPIVCFQDVTDRLPNNIKFIAYEPPWAISKGYEDSMKTVIEETPETVIKVKKKLKIQSDKCFIYGGSVNSNNISQYLKYKEIDGYLVGGASLNPATFYEIVSQV
ncbi:hypothetical protein COS31_02040 [Candidatus Roizmanbacteria bacterium CG02_land_8_20_14_3_00_36_15]|uniref:Triosephosphate isomerase n=2 Tax=Candidatus Roizmaniibacteriota TaxID=1752723 RepID=A0A2M8KLW5_9BACT|nr:MAG: hypothetical protein COS51_03315 [Candidatus Roizmanbacteria bacterium CG03_land_8_20_14_0_80_36_21]PIV37845.1 MAG: hypothetical protein COS31_02040 [Candidatus Roizmanbacteria bacterium CG02_land_8_20_14_3_00_36_15]PIY70196.1 MAG: hypothetical protein COY89_02530 [Candidatus Roizmanbacteria bacterium CG_4_10_14_0_8_um_filter_36_36]PJA53411.1 MAG: hypothetical protein CO166_01905 [Candidatus Roizmanbacteria bacterium CG_4_9_14_3_um_filter_36_11]PJC81352.1 MAG: hypothetical protein CO007